MTFSLGTFGSSCAACGHDVATFRYCVERCDTAVPGLVTMTTRIGEPPHPHVHRVCGRCGYEWLERCLKIRMHEDGAS